MARVHFGDWNLKDTLDELQIRATDWTPVMSAIAADMKELVISEVFPSEGAGVSPAWAPLSQATIKRDKYERGKYGKPARTGILRLSGWLMQMTSYDASRSNAAVINRAPHAHLVQDGTQGGRIPSRVFLYVDERRANDVYLPMLLDYFYSGLGGE